MRAPGVRPKGSAASSMFTRTRGGRSGCSSGTRSKRADSFAGNSATASTLAVIVAIVGRDRRGAATWLLRAQASAQPTKAANNIHATARPPRPPLPSNSASPPPIPVNPRKACHAAASGRPNQAAIPTASPTGSHRGSWSRSDSSQGSIRATKLRGRGQMALRPVCGVRSAMLGALTIFLRPWPAQLGRQALWAQAPPRAERS